MQARHSLLALALLLLMAVPALAQNNGGNGHQYPDVYPVDEYIQLNPDAVGQAFIDRFAPTHYPTIVFNHFGDFVQSITFEEENWATFFPLGVNLLCLSMHDDSNMVMEHFVFEPALSQFLVANSDDQAFYFLLNPTSTANFLLYQNADKPVKNPIGYVYEVFIDDNGNGKRDAGEDVYVGSSTRTRIGRRFRDHEVMDEMIDNPKHEVLIYPVSDCRSTQSRCRRPGLH